MRPRFNENDRCWFCHWYVDEHDWDDDSKHFVCPTDTERRDIA